MTGVLLLAVGAVVVLSQVFTPIPAQGLFAAGLLAALFGGLMLCDDGGR